MTKFKAFGLFWYDFIIGDDWRLALGVALGLAGTALVIHHSHFAIWWIMPLAVMATLWYSLRRATK